MTDLVGKRVRVKNPDRTPYVPSFAKVPGTVVRQLGNGAYWVKFDEGGRAWFFPHELEPIEEERHAND